MAKANAASCSIFNINPSSFFCVILWNKHPSLLAGVMNQTCPLVWPFQTEDSFTNCDVVMCRWCRRRTYQVTWFWVYRLGGRGVTNLDILNQICWGKTNAWPGQDKRIKQRCSYWVRDVGDGVHADASGYRQCVHPVQGSFVLVFQQVGAVYCHLAARTSMLVSGMKSLWTPFFKVRLTLKASFCARMMVSKGAPCL